MAFPTTPVLSSFAGANEEPLSEGGAWGGTIRAAGTLRQPLRVLSNQVAPGTSATAVAFESVYGTTYQPDMECYVTQPVVPGTANHGPAVWVRVQNEGVAGADGYNLSYVFGTGLQFYRMVDSSFTQLGSTVVQVVAAGDSFGLSVIGTTLEGWYKPSAGSWTSIGTRSDGNITGSGKIAIALTGGSGATTRLDDFGGGLSVTSGRRYKRLYGPAQLGSSAATLYTVPDGGRAVIRNIYANNPSGSPVNITLSIGADADATHIFDADPVPAGDILFARRETNYVLEAGEVLQGFASSAGTVVLTVNGVEYGL